MKSIHVDNRLIINMYINKQMSTNEIAKELGVSKNTVNRNLQKSGVKLRDKLEAQKIAVEKQIKEAEERRKNKVGYDKLICPNCKKEFWIKKRFNHPNEMHFCSKSCKSIYYGHKRAKRGKFVKCKYCGKEHYKQPRQLKARDNQFCSQDCFNKWMTTEENKGQNNPRFKRYKVKCAYCGKELLRIKSKIEKIKNTIIVMQSV